MNIELVKENFKRYALIPLIGTMFMFLCGPFVALMGKTGANEVIDNMRFFFMFINCLVAGICAVTVFSYLNRTASTSVMHSMPFSRKTLYVSNCVSGLLMAVIPMLMNAAALLLIGLRDRANAGPTFSDPAPVIGSWVLTSLVIILFVYSIAVIASMVCGNTVIALITGICFNFVVPAVVLCFNAFAGEFLYGFTLSETAEKFLAKSHPLICVLTYEEMPVLIYLVLAAAFLASGYFLYRMRPLEKAEDSYVFPVAREAMGFILTFFASSLAGFLCFEIIGETKVMSYVGMFIGLLLGFIVSRIIVTKTFRIFNLDTLKAFLIVFIIIAMIVAGFALDLTGYEKRMPDPADVESVTLDSYFIVNSMCDARVLDLTEEDSIREAERIHGELIEREGNDGYPFYITYSLRSGGTIRRYYMVSEEWLSEGLFDGVMESKEVAACRERLLDLDVSRMSAFYEYYGGDEDAVYYKYDSEYEYGYEIRNTVFTAAEKEELLECIVKDLKARDFKEILSVRDKFMGYVNLELSVDGRIEPGDYDDVPGYQEEGTMEYESGKTETTVYFTFEVYEYDANTIGFLRNHLKKA